MIKKIIWLLIISVCIQSTLAQSTFSYFFKNPLHQVIGDIIETDNECLVFPILTSVPRETKIFKIDKEGNILDSVLIDTISNTFLRILKYNSNCFFIAGCMNTFENDTFCLLKYDYNFNRLKELKIPAYGAFDFSNFIPLYVNNKGNIVTDFISHKSDFDAQTCLLEISPDCEIIKSKIFTSYHATGYTCTIIQKSKYYYFFISGLINDKAMVCNIYKLDTCFNNYGFFNILEPYGALWDLNTTRWINDSVFLLTSYYTPNNYAKTKVFKMLADTSSLQPIKLLEIMDNDSSIRIAWYNNLDFFDVNNIFVGSWMYKTLPDYFQHVNTKFVLTKIDSTLNIKWQKKYGGDGYYDLYGVKATQDGGCVMGGTYYGPEQNNEKDPFIMKVDGNGNISWVHNLPDDFIKLTVYPNPGSNQMTVNNPPLHTKIILFDISGKPQKEQNLDVNNTINTEDLKTGIYFYNIIDDKEKVVAKGKWVKSN